MARPAGYSGYYPGDRIPRNPSGGGGRITPYEYDLNVLAQAIEEMEIDVENAPKWVIDRLNSDLKTSLRANVYGGALDASVMIGYEEEEMEQEIGELSGQAALGVNLDPRVIVKDPGKWAKDIGEGVYEELRSLKELDSRKRASVWRSITGIGPEAEGINNVLASIHQRQALQRAGEGGIYPKIIGSPLSIGKLTAEVDGKTKEAGKDLATEIVDFQSNIQNRFFRDGNFDKVMQKALSGGRAFVEEGLQKGAIANTGTANDGTFAAIFLAEQDLLENMGDLQDTIRKTTTIIPQINYGLEGLDLGEQIDNIRREINKSRATITLLTQGVEGVQAGLNEGAYFEGISFKNPKDRNAYVKSLQERIDLYRENAPADGKILNQTNLDEILPHVKEFEKRLEKIEGKLPTKIPTTNAERNRLVRELNAVTVPLRGGRNFMEGGIQRNYSKFMVKRWISMAKKDKGQQKLLDLARNNPDMAQYLKASGILLPSLERDRMFFSTQDLMDTLYRGNFFSAYVWASHINPRLRALAPDYYVGLFMKRMHYFGLIVDERMLLDENGNPTNPKFFLYRRMNKFVRKHGGLFENRFDITLKNMGKTVKVAGGAHFGAVAGLSKALKDDPSLWGKLLAAGGDKSKLEALLEDIDGVSVDKFLKFKDWLTKEAGRLGIKDIRNIDNIKDLLSGLLKYDADKVKNIGIGITRAYRGFLEKLVQKVSVVQDKIFKSVLGKFASKVIGWKNALSHSISVAITGAITAATGGAGSFIAGALEKAIQVVTRVVIDIGEKVVKSIISADFSELSDFLDKSMANVLKLLAQLGMVFALVIALTLTVVTALLGAIPGENNSKVGAIGSQGVGEGTPGDTTVDAEPPIDIGSCVVEGDARIWNNRYSYGYDINTGEYYGEGGYAKWGHGTDRYWASDNPDCYPMPGGWVYAGRPRSHTEAMGVCSTRLPRSDYYGFAADFTSSDSDHVRLPELGRMVNGEILWNYTGNDVGSQGTALFFSRNDGVNLFEIVLLHLDPSPGISVGNSYEAGTHVGDFWEGNGLYWKHVHVEIVINGDRPIRPENVLCTT